MTLVLSNAEIWDLVTMEDLIPAVESAFRETLTGDAITRVRLNFVVPTSGENRYWSSIMSGAIPSVHAFAIRVISSPVRDVVVDGQKRREFPGDFTGLVYLYDTETAELQAVMHDHFFSVMTVAAVSGVAARQMARKDSHRLGLFGAGEHAKTQLLAMKAVRPIQTVKVYSLRRERRETFAREMSELTGLEIRAVDRPEDAVIGCDIVNAATNSNEPVFDSTWLEPGTHVTTVVGGFYDLFRDEVDRNAYLRSQVIAVSTFDQVTFERQGFIYQFLEEGAVRREQIQELAEMAAGRKPGRRSPADITLFKNNHVAGIQIAAMARLVYEAARKKGIGHELSTELFVTRRGDGTWAP